MDTLSWLQDWYFQHCNDNWEHQFGISITTLDNPGWRLTINLQDTELSLKTFQKISIRQSETDWIDAWIKDKKFELACGAKNLDEALQIFRDFASS